jgi:hypothetical protein
LYNALAKAAGRDSFWRGDGGVKTPIGVYKYDPATGAFLLALYDRPTAENIVGYIKEDGTPVVVKRTQNMSEALEEYNKLLQKPKAAGGFASPPAPATQSTSAQSSQQTGFLQPLRSAADFLANAFKTGASITLTALGGARPSPADSSGGQQFVATAPRPASERRAVYNRRRGMPGSSQPSSSPQGSSGRRPADYLSNSEFVQLPPGKQQKADESVAIKPVRPPDYVLIETKTKSSESPPSSGGGSGLSSSRQKTHARPPDYVLAEQKQSSGSGRPSGAQVAETFQRSEAKRYRGRPVAVPA